MVFDFGVGSWVRRGEPVSGPVFDWGRVSQVVVHYPGNPVSWVPPRDVAGLLRRQQSSWLRSRGYSLGYNAVVVSHVGHPLDGSVWEVRGDRFRCAANAGVNEVSFAVQVVQRSGDVPSPAAVEGVRRLVGQVQDRVGVVRVVGHNDSGGSTRTLCPGAGLSRAVRDRVFVVEPGPVPVPVVGDDEMIAIYRPVFAGANANTPWVAVFQSGVVRRAVNADVRLAEQLKVPIVDQDSEEQHRYLVSIFPKG